MNATPQKSAALTKFNDITFKRGQIVGSQRGGDNDFVVWASNVYDGSVGSQFGGGTPNAVNYRREITVQQFDATNALVRTWVITNAWPKRFKAFSDLNGLGNDNSIEELTVTHEGFDLR